MSDVYREIERRVCRQTARDLAAFGARHTTEDLERGLHEIARELVWPMGRGQAADLRGRSLAIVAEITRRREATEQPALGLGSETA